jgi:hypothetical protein
MTQLLKLKARDVLFITGFLLNDDRSLNLVSLENHLE